MAANLSAEQELNLGARVLNLRARGFSDVEISRTLEIHRRTVKRLRDKYVDEVFSDADREDIRNEVLETYRMIKREASMALERRVPDDAKGSLKDRRGQRWINPTSHNLPKLLDNILSANDSMVKLLGLAEPEEFRHEIKTPLERTKAYEEHKARQRENFEVIYGGRSDEAEEEETG